MSKQSANKVSTVESKPFVRNQELAVRNRTVSNIDYIRLHSVVRMDPFVQTCAHFPGFGRDYF